MTPSFSKVAGDGDDGQRRVKVGVGVEQQQTLCAAVEQELGVVLDQLRLVIVAGGEVEEVLLQEVALDALHDDGEVAFAVLGDHDADRVAAGLVQVQSEVAGPVVELAGCFVDAAAGLGGEVLGQRRVVQNEGDSGLGDAEVRGEILQAGSFFRWVRSL